MTRPPCENCNCARRIVKATVPKDQREAVATEVMGRDHDDD